MKKYRNKNLESAIQSLEVKKKAQYLEISNQLGNVYEGLKPMNIINNTLNDLKNEPDTKQNIIESAISLAGGYISKKLLFGSSNSILKRLTGYGLQIAMTKLISNKISSTTH